MKETETEENDEQHDIFALQLLSAYLSLSKSVGRWPDNYEYWPKIKALEASKGAAEYFLSANKKPDFEISKKNEKGEIVKTKHSVRNLWHV